MDKMNGYQVKAVIASSCGGTHIHGPLITEIRQSEALALALWLDKYLMGLHDRTGKTHIVRIVTEVFEEGSFKTWPDNIPSPQEIHDNARSKGWYDGPDREVPELLCLVHSERSEALEGYRNHVKEGEKGCLSEELADAVIRIFDMSEYLGIDIAAAIRQKHEYNKTRPHRHGGKKC